jgi:ABC-2 type transport system permease protein
MRGFAVFARKEAVEILRTWRIWVLPGILLFFALTGPVMAKFTPEIVGAVGGSQAAALLKAIPKPTYIDSYAQWIKNLSQIALFAVVIIYGGLISSESKSGTAVLVLTKPVSRTAFVVAKALVHAAFLSVTLIVGTLITWGGTAIAFGKAPATVLFSSAGAWLAFGLLFLAIMMALSALLDSQAGAAGIGLGVYVAFSVAGMWKPLATYSPAALVAAPARIVSGESVALGWPIATAALLAVALVAFAAWSFGRKEL